MISITVNSNKLTVINYVSSIKVLESFSCKIIDNYTVEFDQKKYNVWKRSNLTESVFTLERKGLFKSEEYQVKFNVLGRRTGEVTVSITGASKLLNKFDKNAFIQGLNAFETVNSTTSKTIVGVGISREKIPEVINMVREENNKSTFLLWLFSNQKYVRLKFEKGELTERFGDFSLLGDNVDIVIKELATI